MIAWTTIENAIQAWFATATGLTTIWSSQDAPQPAYPYASLKRITQALREHERDEIRQSYDENQPLGQEIGVSVEGQRLFTVSCQVFAASDAPAANADHYLGLAESALELPSARRTLRAAHVVPVDIVGGNDFDQIASGGWKSRSNMDVRFRTVSVVEERTGYIERAEITATITKPDGSTIVRTDTVGETP